jgi:hypothetical protein
MQACVWNLQLTLRFMIRDCGVQAMAARPRHGLAYFAHPAPGETVQFRGALPVPMSSTALTYNSAAGINPCLPGATNKVAGKPKCSLCNVSLRNPRD